MNPPQSVPPPPSGSVPSEAIEKIIRQLHGEPDASEIIAGIRKIRADEILELERLREENPRLRGALLDVQAFIQHVGTEDPEDIETMASIERLSGRIAAALSP